MTSPNDPPLKHELTLSQASIQDLQKEICNRNEDYIRLKKELKLLEEIHSNTEFRINDIEMKLFNLTRQLKYCINE